MGAKAIQLNSNSVQALLLKGAALRNMGRVQEAIIHFREAIRLAPCRLDCYEGEPRKAAHSCSGGRVGVMLMIRQGNKQQFFPPVGFLVNKYYSKTNEAVEAVRRSTRENVWICKNDFQKGVSLFFVLFNLEVNKLRCFERLAFG